jgi:hypothetical protein
LNRTRFEKGKFNAQEAALVRLRQAVPRLCSRLSVAPPAGTEGWERVFDSKLLPRISPDFPLVAAICGGGSSGKSTLFNALAGAAISPTGGSAGINRRVLVCGRQATLDREDLVSVLFAPFGCLPEPMESPDQLTQVGCPVYAASEVLPADLLLMDTPDFDTGSRGAYVNRETTRQALEAADLLIYIFTNSNYNNRDNTDFISRMLTGIGRRRCLLVYRAYPSFSDEQVRDHAMVAARNLYEAEAEDAVLGIYRADEDNEVASGGRAMSLRPVPPFSQNLVPTLIAIDPRKERGQLQDAIVSDVLDAIRATMSAAEAVRAELSLYLDALQLAQSRCVADALRQIPMDEVMRRFADIWMATDPAHIRFMRRAGSVVEAPLRLIMTAVKWARKAPSPAPPAAGRQFRTAVEEDLLDALHRLYAQAVGPEVSVAGPLQDPSVRRMKTSAEGVGGPVVEAADDKGEILFRVPAPEAVAAERRRLEARPWQEIVDALMAKKSDILEFSEELDRELTDLAESLRKRMGLWDQVRQTFSALLNILPATAAVTYILHTGDPVGAAGIKVKLTGLFGLHDLVALVAIPATSGMKAADRQQLESLLVPIARAWLSTKLDAVRELFEAEITGSIIRAGREAIGEAETLAVDIEKDLARCQTAISRT